MVVYSFHIFDRHAACIYSKRWNQIAPATPSPAPAPAPAPKDRERPSSSSTFVATNGDLGSADVANSSSGGGGGGGGRNKQLSHEDDAKLIFGVVYSLRNIARKLGGDDNAFLSYRTKEYKLHYYETLTRIKFVMLTDTKTNNLQLVLHQIWATLYVEYVVKNPLSPVEHTDGVGVANELFEAALERFMTSILS